MTDVSPAIAARMSEMAAEILALRARLAAVMAVPACRDTGHAETIHAAAGCCDPYGSSACTVFAPQDWRRTNEPHRFHGSGGSQWCDLCGEADTDPAHAAGGLIGDV